MKKEVYPKILVISHNPFSKTQNNGKTLAAFFKDWPSNKLAQLFLTLDRIDTDVCDSFYRISDVEVLKAWVKHNNNYGNEINKDTVESFNDDKTTMHQNKLYILVRNLFQKRLPLSMIFRSFVWNRVKPWKNDKLNRWIEQEKPELIFFQSSNVYAIYDMVYYISKRYNIPIIMETTDDYVTYSFSLNPFKYLNIYLLRKKYKKLVSVSKCVFAIGEKMALEYTKKFGGNFKVAMNSIEFKSAPTPYKVKTDNFVFTYAGNLGLNRWKILYKLGKSFKKIHEKYELSLKLNIYSLNEMPKKVLKKLNLPPFIEFKGGLNSQELNEVRNNSDFLVHVESDDPKQIEITRLSISTKIPEYLLSERCILAIGPSNVASIEYLRDNNSGKVINKINEEYMCDEIYKLVSNSNQILEYIKNGKDLAKKNHQLGNIKKSVQDEILEAVRGE